MSSDRRRQAEELIQIAVDLPAGDLIEGGDKGSFVSMKPLLAGLLVLVSVSCVSDNDYWMFKLTRTVWSEDGLSEQGEHSGAWGELDEGLDGDDDDLALFAGVFIVLPLAVDVVLLPITLIHDLLIFIWN